MEQYGLVDQSIVSGPNKQILSVTKTLTPPQRALLQGIVDELYGRFVRIVAQGRKLEIPAVKTIADGRVLTASQALKAGLVDKIGYERDALAYLKSKSGSGPFNIVRYRQQPSLWNIVGTQLGQARAVPNVASTLNKIPRAYYLYGPRCRNRNSRQMSNRASESHTNDIQSAPRTRLGKSRLLVSIFC